MANEGCDPDWIQFRNVCLKYVNTATSITNAASYCSAYGAYIVEITNSIKECFVEQNLLLNETTWIGLRDVVGDDQMSSHRWMYSNLSIVETGYTKWSSLSPDLTYQECIALVLEGNGEWKWYDRKCSKAYHFICEKGKNSLTSISNP